MNGDMPAGVSLKSEGSNEWTIDSPRRRAMTSPADMAATGWTRHSRHKMSARMNWAKKSISKTCEWVDVVLAQ